MVSSTIGEVNGVDKSEILCYYFNESSEKQIVNIKKNYQENEVVLQPKQGMFFEAMPDTFIKIYRLIFSGREIVDAIRCRVLRVCEKAQETNQYQAIAWIVEY
jgi:hypothetical protein